MQIETAVLMVVSLGIVWGGFLTILVIAIRKEHAKKTAIHD